MDARTLAIASLFLAGCQAAPPHALPLAGTVDLRRFMGDWYVIAATPTFIDAEAHDAVESYRLADDGSIATTYVFRDGSFEGPSRRYTPRGFVEDRATNAVWSMRIVWPFKADYRIAWLAQDYDQAIVAREKRDYAWIMARTARIPESDYARRVQFLADAGYDTSRLRRIPHRPPAAQTPEPPSP
jgi:apolipoprotein D and lipocalin family protein